MDENAYLNVRIGLFHVIPPRFCLFHCRWLVVPFVPGVRELYEGGVENFSMGNMGSVFDEIYPGISDLFGGPFLMFNDPLYNWIIGTYSLQGWILLCPQFFNDVTFMITANKNVIIHGR